MSAIAALMLLPVIWSVLRSGPKIFIAIAALVPESIWSMRWPSGCPTVTATPGMALSLALTSSKTSSFGRLPSLKLTSISAPLVAWECSSRSPRPVRREVRTTSGMVSNSLSISSPSWSLTSSELPWPVTAEMVIEPSLKSGRKLLPIKLNTTTAPARSRAVAPRTAFLWLIAASRALAYQAESLRLRKLSLSFLSRYFSLASRSLQSSGVRVIATSRDMKSAMMKEIPRGLSSLPSIPSRKKRGVKATMMMRVALITEERISREPSNTTLKTESRSEGAFLWF